MMVVPLAPGLGRVIREFRKSQGMSMQAFANYAGLSKTYLRGIEDGRRNPSLLILNLLSRSLGVRVSDLISAAEQRDEA
jgi:transcriptional regulator with XRE-family HTH domain